MRVARCIEHAVLIASAVTGGAVVDGCALRPGRCVAEIAVTAVGPRSSRHAVLIAAAVVSLAAVDEVVCCGDGCRGD